MGPRGAGFRISRDHEIIPNPVQNRGFRPVGEIRWNPLEIRLFWQQCIHMRAKKSMKKDNYAFSGILGGIRCFTFHGAYWQSPRRALSSIVRHGVPWQYDWLPWHCDGTSMDSRGYANGSAMQCHGSHSIPWEPLALMNVHGRSRTFMGIIGIVMGYVGTDCGGVP